MVRQQGYIAFTRPWAEVFRPNTRPSDEQRLGQFRVATIGGQWEPVVLCLYPLQELGGVPTQLSRDKMRLTAALKACDLQEALEERRES